MSHFDEMSCLLYIEGQLESERASALSEHVRMCRACRALLHALQQEERLLHTALVEEDEPVPARLVAPPSRARVPWGWLVSFGLASGGAYTLWTGYIEPWQQQFNQAGFTQGNLLTMLFFSGAFWKGWSSMLTTMGFLGLATISIVALYLLRRTWSRRTPVAAVLAGFALMMIGAPAPAMAAEIQKGNPGYTLPAGQTVPTDLIVAAEHTRIDGTVEGDLISFSETVTVTGHVTGDILVFTRELRIEGRVDGNVRCFTQSFYLTGGVAKNISMWAENIELDPKSEIGGSITFGAKNAELDGHIARDILAFARDAELDGGVRGNIKGMLDEITIGPHADLAGKTDLTLGKQPRVDPAAKLATSLNYRIERHHHPQRSYTAEYFWHAVLKWGAAFVFGLGLILLLPGFFREVVRSSTDYGPAIGFGVLFLFAIPIAAILVCITIVGLGVGLTALFLWAISLYAAQIFVGARIGEWILHSSPGTGAALGRLALGLLVLHALFAIPFVGALVCLAALVWGLGALVVACYRYLKPQSSPAPVPQPAL